MLFITLAFAASLLSFSSAAAIDKRSTETVSLYGYGTNISGFVVFYGDGMSLTMRLTYFPTDPTFEVSHTWGTYNRLG